MFLTAREVMCYALGLQSLCDPHRKFKGHPTVYTLTITNKKTITHFWAPIEEVRCDIVHQRRKRRPAIIFGRKTVLRTLKDNASSIALVDLWLWLVRRRCERWRWRDHWKRCLAFLLFPNLLIPSVCLSRTLTYTNTTHSAMPIHHTARHPLNVNIQRLFRESFYFFGICCINPAAWRTGDNKKNTECNPCMIQV